MPTCEYKDAAGDACVSEAVFGLPGAEPYRCVNHAEDGMEDTRGGQWGKKTLLAWMASLDSMEARQAMAIIEPLPEDDARFIEGSQKFYTMKTSMHFLDQRMAALGFWVVQTAGV